MELPAANIVAVGEKLLSDLTLEFVLHVTNGHHRVVTESRTGVRTADGAERMYASALVKSSALEFPRFSR